MLMINDISLVNRIKLALYILFKGKFRPVIKFSNGVEIDIKNNKIVLNDPLEIHSKGNLIISSDKHLILSSGRKDDPNMKGTKYSIWLNPPVDKNKNPIRVDNLQKGEN